MLLLMSFFATSVIGQEIKPLLISGVGQMYNNNYDQGHYYYGILTTSPYKTVWVAQL
jgi:hypothetical protein